MNTTNKKIHGRPAINIDTERLIQLTKEGHTIIEMAEQLGCSRAHLISKYSKLMATYRNTNL